MTENDVGLVSQTFGENLPEQLTRSDRVRRVVRVCLHCTRNLAYYRAGWQGKHLVPETSQFWRTVNGNCLDHCVLEWCKLFDGKDHHSWRRFVSDPVQFETELLIHVGISAEEFGQFAETVRRYRDKFVAHLDSDKYMDIPVLDIVKKSTAFYHQHVVAKEAQPGDLADHWECHLDPSMYYEICFKEAAAVYKRFNPHIASS